MIPKSFLLCCCLALCAGATAQDSQPTSSDSGPVKIDNERVTVSDITLDLGKPVSMESHKNDFVTMFLVGGKIRTTGADGQSHVMIRKAGDAVFIPKGSEKTEEAVSGQARMFVVDLKDFPSPKATNTTKYPDAFPRPGSKKVLENDRIAVWNYAWKLGVPTPMHYHFREVVVVYRGNGSLKSVPLDGDSVVNEDTFGMVRFNKAGRTHYEELVKGEESAIILELK
jgi:quercetin dioxygenase-like cupin family protein